MVAQSLFLVGIDRTENQVRIPITKVLHVATIGLWYFNGYLVFSRLLAHSWPLPSITSSWLASCGC